MADNVSVTAGTGTVIATDDVGGIQYQRVKLVDGTADSSAAIAGDATNGLDVDVTRVAHLPQYRAATATILVTAATNVTPFFAFYGSATKTIRIQEISIEGATWGAAAFAYVDMCLCKYSTAISGAGTDLVQVPCDSSYAAGTASLIRTYTAASTPGTLVGLLGNIRFMAESSTAANGIALPEHSWKFDESGDGRGSIVLRGTSQGVCMAFTTSNAQTVSLVIEVAWTEE